RVVETEARVGPAGVGQGADTDLGVSRTELQHVIDAALVEHIGWRHRAGLPGEDDTAEAKAVVQASLAERIQQRLVKLAVYEKIDCDDNRIDVHAELREVEEIKIRNARQPPSAARVAGLADRDKDVAIDDRARTGKAPDGQCDEPVPIRVVNDPWIEQGVCAVLEKGGEADLLEGIG